jgi:ABC-2 type transport system ATP-binding protein
MADRVAILLRGRIVATGSPRELTATGNGLTKISVYATGCDLKDANFQHVDRESTQENYRIYYTAETGTVVAAIIARIQETGGSLVDLRVERPSLEERFLELTAKEVS